MKLYNRECIETMKEIPDNSIDLVLTDPPYGTTKCKWDTVINFAEMWQQIDRISKNNAAICLFGQNPFSSRLICSNIENFRYDWVWNKRKAANIMSANKMPLKILEYVHVFYKKLPNYYPQKTINPKGKSTRHKYAVTQSKTDETSKTFDASGKTTLSYSKNYDPSMLNPKVLIEFKKPSKPVHPTQKPVELLEYLIKTYTRKGETVLDFTMGSGSTGVAAKNLRRNFVGIELDEIYFKIAQARIDGNEELAKQIKKENKA